MNVKHVMVRLISLLIDEYSQDGYAYSLYHRRSIKLLQMLCCTGWESTNNNDKSIKD